MVLDYFIFVFKYLDGLRLFFFSYARGAAACFFQKKDSKLKIICNRIEIQNNFYTILPKLKVLGVKKLKKLSKSHFLGQKNQLPKGGRGH